VAPLVAALVPPALIGAAVARLGVNVPLVDQWGFGPVVADAFRGQLDPRALWVPNNEHRMVLPGLVMLALVPLTRWDVRYEMALNVLAAIGILGLLTAMIRRTVRPFAPAAVPWLVLAASLFTFSMAQWQNWTWGWQLAIFMNVLAACGVAWGLAGPLANAPLALAAIAVGGALSFASGLLLLGLAPLGLLLVPSRDHGIRRLRGAAMCGIVCVALGALHVYGLRPAPGQPRPVSPLDAPLAMGRYVVAYLGASLAPWDHHTLAVRWGAAGVITLVLGSAGLWITSPRHRAALVPWLVLALYAALSGCMTAVGRLGAGSGTAVLSRYITISTVFWTSTIVVTTLAIAELLARVRGRIVRGLVLGAALVVTLLAARAYRHAWSLGESAMRRRNVAASRGLACLRHLDLAPDGCLERICWDANVLRRFAQPLREQRLGPFAGIEPEPPLSSYLVEDGAAMGRIEVVLVNEGSKTVTIMGSIESAPLPDALLIAVDGAVVARPEVIDQRPRSAGGAARVRWRLMLRTEPLGAGPHRLDAYALWGDRRVARLAGGQTF
jgi:hypothetical protein